METNIWPISAIFVFFTKQTIVQYVGENSPYLVTLIEWFIEVCQGGGAKSY
jgi:hypothetical protein